MTDFRTALMLMALVLLVSGCRSGHLDQKTAQACVDRVVTLLDRHDSLYALAKSPKVKAANWKPKNAEELTALLREELPPKTILSAFPKLALRPGMTLDYLYYRGEVGSWPVLYTRPVENPSFDSYESLTRAMPAAESIGSLSNTWSKGFGFYVDNIFTDDTEEGFFQLVALYLMGDQFFHFWHDYHHDELIVCSRSGLDTLFKKADATASEDREERIPDDVRQAAYALSLSPKVDIQSNTVTVSIVIFTKWGGFERRSYTICRQAPHIVLSEECQVLVEYNCGIII